MQEPKLCSICKKNPVHAEKARFCENCLEARRSWQLVINNQKWRARLREGKSDRRLLYNGEITEWAKKNPVEAIRKAIDEGYNDEMLKGLIDALLKA